jgi:peptidoglycan/LPS O-acetylase OafA/YrhL
MKNNTLNFIKTIACAMVVFIHIKFPYEYGYYVTTLARFGVPFFFMISGYFSFKNVDNSEYIIRQIKKILKISFLSFGFYLLFDIFINLENFIFHLSLLFNFNNIKLFLFYNVLPCGMHLWYLFSLIYVYIIYYYFNCKLNKINILHYFTPVLILLCVLFEYLSYFDIFSIDTFKIRNYLFVGLPFFMLGNFIHKHENSFFVKSNNNLFFIIIGIVGLIISLFESYLTDYLDIYVGTVLFVFCLFIFAIKNPNIFNSENIICVIGEKYSLGIYVSHLFIILFLGHFGNFGLNAWIVPFVVLIISLFSTWLYYFIMGKIIKN